MNWLFADPPNMAVISHRRIVERENSISFVSHDEDDGGWQFLPNSDGALDASEAVVASFKSIVDIDSSIVELADLPLGWCARRPSQTEQWIREKI
ncbi:immunity protein Imm33 domain-containing protein [Herbaspirillum sp. CF444]|uniref:immunity protein Imm33 domain-containing protein n=1 Tax=Herbaspirillum sp. CF444 TaxID=1144319 RepID=UPI0009DA97B0|nr:DUF2185 domain-containing protein [Herbaspirillum sp. CF444]